MIGFHDVFHLAYAAVLGWSPTTRALLKIKRKSRPEIDENEDGARAKSWVICFIRGSTNSLYAL